MKLKTKVLATLAALVAVAGLAVLPASSQWQQIYTNAISNASGGTNVGLLNIDGGSGATNGVTIGSSSLATPIKGVFFIDSAQTPGSQATITCAPQSFTVTGVTTADQVVLVQWPATGNGTGYGVSHVTATNTIAQVVCNPTAGSLTPAAGTFTYMVVRR
jgi:hypothetical protein